MIIIKVQGGMGNQMFQYALYRKLKSHGKDAKLDITLYSKVIVHDGFLLGDVFGLKLDLASETEVSKLGDVRRNLIFRAKRKFGIKKRTHFEPRNEQTIAYIPEILQMDNIYLDGYWQSEKYFMDIESLIREDFSFKNSLVGRNYEASNEIANHNSVSLHVRRGDYLNVPLYQHICTLDYYNKAIQYITKQIKEPRFYVFSDDISWCKANLSIKNAIFVDWNTGKSNDIDMQLMSLCKHNIIANSSFSWWGAWLNRNPEKIVIAPMPWFSDYRIYQDDIVPSRWVRITG